MVAVRPNETVSITIERDDQVQRLKVKLGTDVAQDVIGQSFRRGLLGVTSTTRVSDPAPVYEAVPLAAEYTWRLTRATVDAVVQLVRGQVSVKQLGGPIKHDKLWFFGSFQYYRPQTSPSGYPPPGSDIGIGPSARKEQSPRFIFKPTLRLGTADQLTGFIEYDRYDIEGRGAASNVEPAATVKETAPEWAWNGNYTKVLSPSTVFDVKYSGYWGYYDLNPYNGFDTMGWYDPDLDFYSVNSYYFYYADRTRHQANTSLTKYSSGFAGEHNLKFGAEFERSYAKTELGYPGGGYILASYGVPYYAYLGGDYIQDAIDTRFSVFAQDSWSVGPKLTINAGLRFDNYRGYLRALDDTVLNTKAWGPRVGFAYDLNGNGRTVLRGHYGRYYDGAKASYYDLLNGESPTFGVYIDPVTLAPISQRMSEPPALPRVTTRQPRRRISRMMSPTARM